MKIEQLKDYIYEVPDFPKPGIGFKDISPLVRDAAAYNFTVDRMSDWARAKRPEVIVGIESRGYLFAVAVARDLKLGLDVIRKKGKLPRKTVCVKAPNEYAVEYFEMHEDTIRPGQRVVVIDDLIATGSSSISALDRRRHPESPPRRRRFQPDPLFLIRCAPGRRQAPLWNPAAQGERPCPSASEYCPASAAWPWESPPASRGRSRRPG
jgi:adenine phosphoribosyltransferase